MNILLRPVPHPLPTLRPFRFRLLFVVGSLLTLLQDSRCHFPAGPHRVCLAHSLPVAIVSRAAPLNPRFLLPGLVSALVPHISRSQTFLFIFHRILLKHRGKSCHGMATSDVARTQALAGVSLMTFASLVFQAVWRAAYPDEPEVLKASESLVSTSHAPFKGSEYQELLSKIETLSTTVAKVNSSLHTKIDHEIKILFATGGNWQRQPQVALSPLEIAWIGSIVIVTLWGLGAVIFHENMKGLSRGYRGFLSRLVLLTVLAANASLVAALVFGAAMRGYVYVLYIVWPLQASMAWKVFTQKVEEVGKGEKQ
jgi:hypothetical protein